MASVPTVLMFPNYSDFTTFCKTLDCMLGTADDRIFWWNIQQGIYNIGFGWRMVGRTQADIFCKFSIVDESTKTSQNVKSQNNARSEIGWGQTNFYREVPMQISIFCLEIDLLWFFPANTDRANISPLVPAQSHHKHARSQSRTLLLIVFLQNHFPTNAWNPLELSVQTSKKRNSLYRSLYCYFYFPSAYLTTPFFEWNYVCLSIYFQSVVNGNELILARRAIPGVHTAQRSRMLWVELAIF